VVLFVMSLVASWLLWRPEPCEREHRMVAAVCPEGRSCLSARELLVRCEERR
jgi:hypothetical protein